MVTWRHLLSETIAFGCSRNNESPINIIGIPLDNTSSYIPGTRLAPTSIRDASCNIELNSIYTGKDLDKIGFNDLGDIVVVPGDNIRSLERVAKVVHGIIHEYPHNILAAIGGEHTLTYGVLKGLLKEYNSIGYIVFDAHLDLRKEYMGYRYSHASTQYIIYEEIGIKPVIIGSHAWCSEELDYALNKEIKFYTPNKLEDIDNIIQDVTSELDNKSHIYISIDLDVIDPSYAPGVSNPEPLGLSPVKLLNILHRIIKQLRDKSFIGFDLVEVNPLFDRSRITSILAAKLIVELTAMLLEFNKGK